MHTKKSGITKKISIQFLVSTSYSFSSFIPSSVHSHTHIYTFVGQICLQNGNVYRKIKTCIEIYRENIFVALGLCSKVVEQSKRYNW